jgi:hypothetical protein
MEGEGSMIYTFDDFNGHLAQDSFSGAAIFEDSGWVLTDDGSAPTGDTIQMNSAATVTADFDSCIRIFPGTADDAGGNMQLDMVNGAIGTIVGQLQFPHIWIPETAALPSRGAGGAATVLDNTTWVFATRIGLNTDVTGTTTDWEGKMFIGWAAAGDTSILDHDTGVITDANGELFGFHINETGCIDGISKRTAGDSMTENTNWTRLMAAGSADNTVANGARTANDTMWFDLALRMDITDMSDGSGNGSTRFFSRGPLNRVSPANPGKEEFNIQGQGYMPWQEHGTVLTNQTANGAVSHVPTIECLNGPTAGVDCCMYVDWWTMARSRVSR